VCVGREMSEIREVSLEKIRVGRRIRSRIEEERVKELAATYKRHGIIQPIEIDEENKIIVGERRYIAAKLAGLKTIPCIIRRGLSEEDKLERELIENIHHEPLTDFEKAEAIFRLMELRNWSEREAASHLGFTTKYITMLLALKRVPKEVKELVEEKRIAATDAAELALRLKDRTSDIVKVAKEIAKSERNKRLKLRSALNELRLKENEKRIPEGEFDVIYADPPWQYEFSPDFARSIEAHYPTMSLEEICNLKIPAASSSILFLWATNPKLEEAFQVIHAWGFKYKTNMVWVKDKIGMGFYCRSQHELLLISTKGDFQPPKEKDRFSSVIYANREEHSKKPEVVYELIEKMYPGHKYLELFARTERSGWVGWGLEYGNSN